MIRIVVKFYFAGEERNIVVINIAIDRDEDEWIIRRVINQF